jgi:hypothetical protein
MSRRMLRNGDAPDITRNTNELLASSNNEVTTLMSVRMSNQGCIESFELRMLSAS